MNRLGSSTLYPTDQKTKLDAQTLAWAPSPPGRTIQEDILDRFGMTQGELAQRLGVARRAVNELVGGKRAISTAMALRLSALTGQSPGYWLALQNNYDLYHAEKAFDASKIEPLRP